MKKKAKKAKTTGEAWKPDVGGWYYVPDMWDILAGFSGTLLCKWRGDKEDNAFARSGLVCRTKAQAIRKARAMLRAAKETQ